MENTTEQKPEFLFGHTSRETALEVKGYPWGFRLKTSKFYWIETKAKKGDRLCTMTIDPKTGRECAPKNGNYYQVAVMFRQPNGHISFAVTSGYSKPEEREKFISDVGFENLNAEQQKMVRQLRGEIIKAKDPITGDDMKDFSVKWEKNHMGTAYHEVKITFDRPDGVKIKEIYLALKSLDQKKLNECFEGYESANGTGRNRGFARICVRKGIQLTIVYGDTYKEWCALDAVNNETQNA